MPWLQAPLFDAAGQVAVPYVSGSETSHAGAVHIAPHAGTQMAMVLEAITNHGPLTDTEIKQRTSFDINVVTARRRRLELDGFIVQVGTKTSAAGVQNKLWRVK